MVDGVNISPLQQISDERGKVMHMLKVTDPIFKSFGEIYFSCVYPNAIKAWHIHTQMTINYAVPHGQIKLVLFDNRKDSTTFGEVQEIYLGEDNYYLVTVPPLVWNGFTGLGTQMSIVANCATIPHDPNEIERRDPFDVSIPYDWTLNHQ